jgi:hypothetical protein
MNKTYSSYDEYFEDLKEKALFLFPDHKIRLEILCKNAKNGCEQAIKALKVNAKGFTYWSSYWGQL